MASLALEDHPAVGRIALDCDTLIVALDDLRITVYTAEPGTQGTERRALAVVLGAQAVAHPAQGRDRSPGGLRPRQNSW